MKIPLSLLKEFLPITQTPEKLADVLTMAGLEVEDIKILGNDFNDVVVAKVISTEKHPNAEKLTIARVFDGTEELQIVCGAANCRPGLTTALAKIGATLTDEKGNIYTIKKGRLRDVDSYGMLCSTEELGLPFKEDGIIELESHLEAGRDLKGIVYDVIFDISLTPNLGH
jgi:phenylalanyl-tRNA synthetase beta chain